MSASPMAAAQERFRKDTAKHLLKIEHDAGLYKHLRFAAPETSIYGFSIATWPGYLAIAGDVPTFIFSREPDMLTFFERCHGSPDPVYLSEKLSGEFRTKCYSPDQFKREARRWLNEQLDQMDSGTVAAAENRELLRLAVENDLVRRAPGFREEAMPMLENFEAAGHRIHDPFEWDLEEWDENFLWCLWGIVHVIDLYRKVTA